MVVNLNNTLDLTSLIFDVNTPSGNSNGILYKAIGISGGKKTYFKLGSFNSAYGFYGIEPILELINSRIGKILGINTLDYGLCNAIVNIEGKNYKTMVSYSYDYADGVTCISAENMYKQAMGRVKNPLQMFKLMGMTNEIYKMFIFDYVVCNLDRHGKNIDILAVESGNGVKYRIAPLFDNSLTTLLTKSNKDIENKVAFNDNSRVNNFVGAPNLMANIREIDNKIEINRVHKDDRKRLFQGLGNYTDRKFREYVWNMLNTRLCMVTELNPKITLK